MPHPIHTFLTNIPKGKITTYKILADKFKIHPRAVARILSQNHEPDVFPCYKVVHHDGKLGGYTHELGIEEKIRRLEKDGIKVVNGKISKEYFWLG
ncbi:MAG: MGMT family protein [Candidatus Gracilibacteria bacterium]|nr:MGMT family protein [Candidatus Gracilibacteria bacterium]